MSFKTPKVQTPPPPPTPAQAATPAPEAGASAAPSGLSSFVGMGGTSMGRKPNTNKTSLIGG